MSYKQSLLLALTLIISACNDQQQPAESNQEKPAFNLKTIQHQYADVALTIADISEQSYENGSAIAVTFSVPANPAEDIQPFLKVSDKTGQSVSGAWILSANGLVAYFPEIQPSSDYTVDVFKGLTAATGSRLEANVSQQLTTRRMPAQAGFASKGSVLPAKLAKGLPVISINVAEVDVEFHRIKTDQISRFLAEWVNRTSQSSYSLQRYTAYTDLIYSGRFVLNPPNNTRHTTHLDLAGIDALQQPGIYLAVMKQPGTYNHASQVTYFVISDLGIHARLYHDLMTVHISTLAGGKPAAGVSLSLLDKNGKVVAEAETSAQGEGRFVAPPNSARVLLAQNKGNISLLKLNAPTLDLSAFDIAGRTHKPIEIFTYGPRDLYRPGETVMINALLRDADGNSITAPPINAVIKRPDGQKIKYFTWHQERLGFYQTQFTLPKNARTGQWTLQLTTAGKSSHQYHFQVEAFLPERMELQLGDQSRDNWTDSSSELLIPVSGQYLYGAPAAKNRLSSQVILKVNRHPVSSLEEFYFGDEDEKPPIEFFEVDDLKLDEKGLATLKIPSQWRKVKHSPFSIKVISSLYETGGRPVTRSIQYHLWPQQTLLGIRPQVPLDDIPAETQVSFDILKARSDGTQVSGEVVATLIKERRDYYWEYSDAEGWHSEYSEKNYKVFEQRFTIDEQRPSTISMPVEWGSYLLKVKDVATGQRSSLRFHAGSGWSDKESNQSARPDRVVLKLDKQHYRNGDTVRLQITPPYAGNGFVVVEDSNQPLWLQRVTVPAEGLVLDIPLQENWKRHDIYISSVIFRPGDSKEKITPNRAVGLLHLPMDRQDRQLQVEIKSPTSVVRPEKSLIIPVAITGAPAGQHTLVTLAAVDVGVLNITDFQTPDPYQWFFQPRRYGVEQRDLYHRIIELMDGGLARPRFGGDADQHAGGARPDSAIRIVSLFSGLVESDAQGIANVSLALPDFNGRLRLMAVAFNDHQFGSAESEVTVAAPIIAEASLPRFLAAGDSSTLTLDIRNQSGAQQTLNIDLTASSPIKLDSKPQTLVLADQQKQVLRLPLTAEPAFAQGKIQLSLSNDKQAKETINIDRTWHLGVRPAYPAEIKVQRTVVNPGETVMISTALEKLLPASTGSQLSISPQPPLNLQQQLKSLLHYPYGCLEQTISSTYPWLSITADRLTDLGLQEINVNGKPIDLDSRQQQIDTGIQRLASMQRSNGSFGLWSNTDTEEHWLSAYAADFLLDAREQGFTVAKELLDKTLTRLSQYLNSRGNLYAERYNQAPGHFSFAYKAYAGYILSRVNRAPLGTLRSLYDLHKQEVKSGLPLVHLGLALLNQGDKKRAIQSISEGIIRQRDDSLYLGDYGSRLRDLALMTSLLNRHNVMVPGSDGLIFLLGDELNNRRYLSTQERNALFHAGLALMKGKKTAWQGELLLDKSAIKIDQDQPYRDIFEADEIPGRIQLKSLYAQPLYLQSTLRGYPAKAPEMTMDSIQVERNYYNLEGQVIKLEQLKTGDVLLVHLTLRADQRIADALLVDMIAAGLELENQNLSGSLKTENFRIGGTTIKQMQENSRVKYREYLDDRFVAALDLQKNRPEHLFYLLRAVTPGNYTNPPAYVEDMYRPYIRAIGRSFSDIHISLPE